MELTHASFFSGVGGLDLGLERAGFRTVSFSEVDPYACAVLAERWPGVPNLGDITRLSVARWDGNAGIDGHRSDDERDAACAAATLWSGGFPCQDLSVAGKRRGLAGSRSGLAFAFLDLVERWRPPAILLENVPGLLSSHRGKDFGTLVGRLGELGYVGAYRVLDAQYFGVPQRRRRVFIVALDAGRGFEPDGSAEVLSVGSRCRRHPPAGIEAGPGAADGTRAGVGVIGPLDTALGHHGAGWPDQSVAAGHLIGAPPDPDGVRAPDGLAEGAHDRAGLAATLNSGGNTGGFRTEPGEHLVATLRVGPATPADGGPGDTVPIIVQDGRDIDKAQNGRGWSGDGIAYTVDGTGAQSAAGRFATEDADVMLPLGLDSHRYRCCGNGVVSGVAEWVGLRLAAVLA